MRNTYISRRGWPARFRRELDLLKTAMNEYEASQKAALSALGVEKQKTRQLQQEVYTCVCVDTCMYV